MQEFTNYLLSKQFVSKKQSYFYQLWVNNLYDFIGKNPGSDVENEDIDKYINNITKHKQDWQVKQAQEAIRIYLHCKIRPMEPRVSVDNKIKTQWKLVGSQMVNTLRLKQLSLQTERTYMTWLRGFYRFVRGMSPYLIDGKAHAVVPPAPETILPLHFDPFWLLSQENIGQILS